MKKNSETCFISVDVETAGPIPPEFSLLSIGACLVEDDSHTFERLLKPISEKADPKALEVCQLSIEELKDTGVEPKQAFQEFENWIQLVSKNRTPVFVALNAGFDWSFINYYFHHFHSSNPFGFAPLDIKSLFMGVTNCPWFDAKSSKMVKLLMPKIKADHDALTDAKAQAEIFRLILKLAKEP